MKPATLVYTFFLSVVIIFGSPNADAAQGGQPHSQAYAQPGHDGIGSPASDALVTRTINLTVIEIENGKMLFQPDAISVENGSVVRFVISNPGALDHELFLGSFDEIQEHRQWMRNHPDMRHEDANAVNIAAGGTAELVWRFSDITNLEFACLLPGHREAGMWGVILVHDHLAPRQVN